MSQVSKNVQSSVISNYFYKISNQIWIENIEIQEMARQKKYFISFGPGRKNERKFSNQLGDLKIILEKS